MYLCVMCIDFVTLFHFFFIGLMNLNKIGRIGVLFVLPLNCQFPASDITIDSVQIPKCHLLFFDVNK